MAKENLSHWIIRSIKNSVIKKSVSDMMRSSIYERVLITIGKESPYTGLPDIIILQATEKNSTFTRML